MTPVQRSRRNAYEAQMRSRGIPVIYGRGDESIQITVIPAAASTTVETQRESSSSRIREMSPDFKAFPEDLVIGGNEILPRPGDVLQDEEGTIYEVLADKHGKPAWEWDDPQTKQMFRIHTQMIHGT